MIVETTFRMTTYDVSVAINGNEISRTIFKIFSAQCHPAWTVREVRSTCSPSIQVIELMPVFQT